MKPKIGKYYLLRTDRYYRSIDLQRDVMFYGKLAVKCESAFGYDGYFGSLVNTAEIYDDLETNNDIEFSEKDIISEYKLSKLPLMYMDFPSKFNKD